MKRAGERSAGNLHAPFDVAGDGNQLTVRFVRHSQRKRGATDRTYGARRHSSTLATSQNHCKKAHPDAQKVKADCEFIALGQTKQSGQKATLRRDTHFYALHVFRPCGLPASCLFARPIQSWFQPRRIGRRTPRARANSQSAGAGVPTGRIRLASRAAMRGSNKSTRM